MCCKYAARPPSCIVTTHSASLRHTGRAPTRPIAGAVQRTAPSARDRPTRLVPRWPQHKHRLMASSTLGDARSDEQRLKNRRGDPRITKIGLEPAVLTASRRNNSHCSLAKPGSHSGSLGCLPNGIANSSGRTRIQIGQQPVAQLRNKLCRVAAVLGKVLSQYSTACKSDGYRRYLLQLDDSASACCSTVCTAAS